MVYNPELGLQICDITCVVSYSLLIFYLIFVVFKYLIPLKVTSAYIIMFYSLLTVLLGSCMAEAISRLVDNDPGFMVTYHMNISLGDYARHIASTSYVILGFVISATMFQLTVSLSLVLNIIDPEEAKQRKWTYNTCIVIICVVYIGCSIIEIHLDKNEHKEHLIFEVMGLAVLSLIYFSTSVDLIRKLRIFVLEETQ